MYLVDQQLIEKRLQYIESLWNVLDQRVEGTEQEADLSARQEIWSLAYERAIQMMTEAMLDVGHDMIDGFMMRDAGSYQDIIHVLKDEQVIHHHTAAAISQMIPLRQQLLRQYTDLDDHHVWDTYRDVHSQVGTYSAQIRTYLQDHMGGVSAFRNQGGEQS